MVEVMYLPFRMAPTKVKFEPGAYVDNRRRGDPLIGCDCFQCFGYCLLDPEVVLREQRDTANRLHKGDAFK